MDHDGCTPLGLWLQTSGLTPPFKESDITTIRLDVRVELNRIQNELLHLAKVVQHLGLYPDLGVITMLRYNTQNAERTLTADIPGLIKERFIP